MGQDLHPGTGDVLQSTVEIWMHPAHQKHGEHAPGERRPGADVAADVARVIRIVPVTDREQFLHQPAGKILQDAGGEAAQQSGQQQIVLHRQRRVQDRDRAEAVNRQDGTEQEAAVHRFTAAQRNVGYLPEIARE